MSLRFRLLKNRPLIDGDTHMSAFLTSESWDEYLARMALDGEWGDDIVLRGISELTGRKIVVYSSFQSRTVLTPTNVFEKEELYIGHIRSMMHFVSLRPHFWNMLWPGCKLYSFHDFVSKIHVFVEDNYFTSAPGPCTQFLGESGMLI